MAIKQKEVEKKSRLSKIIETEYPFEKYLFLVVSVLVLLLGTLILTGVLTVKSNFPIIGSIPTQFAILLVVTGSLGLLLALYPFFKPAFPELKKISWPNSRTFLGNSIRTFIFIIIFAALFFLYDSLLISLSEIFFK